MTTNSSFFMREKAISERTWFKDILIVLGASVIIALFAPIAIRLPFSPVPIMTQGHVILLLAAFLGSKRGSLAVLTYLFQGVIGLPVFSGGKMGLLALAGPTGGYLLGYFAAAYITGYLIERAKERSHTKVFAAMSLGNLVIYAFGLPWLAQFTGWQNAFMLGMLPFILGDVFKLTLVSKLFMKWNKH